MPLAAGFVGILPALGLLDEERDGVPPIHLSWIAAVGWSCAVAFFGCVPHFYIGNAQAFLGHLGVAGRVLPRYAAQHITDRNYKTVIIGR